MTTRDTCGFRFCSRVAVSRADFDFSMLDLFDLNPQTRFCAQHLSVLRRRSEKARRLVLPDWTGDSPAVREAQRRVNFFRRKLLTSPARKADVELCRAMNKIAQALGPSVPRDHLATAWAGLQLAIEDSRRRRLSARSTAQLIEMVAFYRGRCARCEDSPWAVIDLGVPSCRPCAAAGRTPCVTHQPLEAQESRSVLAVGAA
jgi:hypothetical protein